jgi:hypothetical protein
MPLTTDERLLALSRKTIVDSIEASAEPLFEPRANVYLMSGRRRRTAGKQ